MRFRYALIFLALALVPLLGLAQVPSEVVSDVPAITSVSPDDAQPNDMPKFFQRDGDNFKSPQNLEAFQLRQQALRERLAGKGTGKIHQVAGGQYVELGLERTDKIFVVLVEYGNQTGVGLLQAAGPQHNQIAQPDRTTDNNTAWQADYNRDHYRNMYFTKMADYYQKQSSGRYTVNGEVTEWVRVPFNGSRYGTNTSVGDPGAWTLIADAINTWTLDRLDEGMTIEQIKAYLQTFDTWDRYDYNHNGNFNEPDGYIDHFQIVHSGAGEEAGGGILGADAIWSHRWFAFYTVRGSYGPDNFKNGGLEFGGGWGANPNGGIVGAANAAVLGVNNNTNPNAANVTNAHPVNHTGIWVGDYTIQPENGGLGVFAHEFGHDLGLPDHYDTNSGSNSIAYWNIMASGSWLGDGGEDIGNTPDHMTAWDKLQLGWLNYELAPSGKFSTHRLGPAETNTKAAQALVVSLPPDRNLFYLYDARVGSLPYGSKAWWGGAADNLDNNMVRALSVPAGSSYLYMRLMYAIESGWDYAYISVSTDNGANWTNLVGQYQNTAGGWSNLTTNNNPNGQNLGNGITGSSSNAWRYGRFSVAAFANQDVLLRVRYKTDEYTYLRGILVDELALDTTPIDGAEAGDNGWTLHGFKATSGVETSNFEHYYIAEYRQYRDYDATLQTGPYTFGFALEPNRVAHYPYQDGLLITYWDTGESNDNTSQHFGEGRSLPVDAHPDPLLRYVAFPGATPYWSPWSAAVQSYDSTFGLQPTDALNLPFYGTSGPNRYQWWQSHPSLPGVPLFNDLNTYWSATAPQASVIVPKTGTAIRVVNTNTQDNFMQVNVEPVK